MGKIWLILFAIILVGLAAGSLFLLSWDIPAPAHQTEKVLPDDAFPN